MENTTKNVKNTMSKGASMAAMATTNAANKVKNKVSDWSQYVLALDYYRENT